MGDGGRKEKVNQRSRPISYGAFRLALQQGTATGGFHWHSTGVGHVGGLSAGLSWICI